ncbi:MAG: hypothetical protein ACLRWP_13675 [Bilophila wadsworthia]
MIASIMPTGGGKACAFSRHHIDGWRVRGDQPVDFADGIRWMRLRQRAAAAARLVRCPRRAQAVREALASGELDCCISPERLSAPGFWDALASCRFLRRRRGARISHGDMISARIIWRFRACRAVPQCPVAAFTATATPEVERDILSRPACGAPATGFVRPPEPVLSCPAQEELMPSCFRFSAAEGESHRLPVHAPKVEETAAFFRKKA